MMDGKKESTSGKKKHVEVELTHNPYLNETTLRIDGVQLSEKVKKDESLLELTRERLQVWIADFFPALHKHCNISSYKVSFTGTEHDYNDLVEVRNQAQSNLKISIETEHVSKGQTDPDTKMSQLNELFNKAKEGPIKEFNINELDKAFKRALKPVIEVYFVATMSAGKSTLINALLGQDLQPSENQACTAIISEIEDHDNMKHFEGKPCYEDGTEGGWIRVDREILSEWNKGKIKEIKLRGNIPMIKSDNIRLVLVDTPGPNNARDPEHKRRTLNAIDDKHKLILFLLDTTNAGTTDEKALLKEIADKIKYNKGKQAHERFVFVVNKIDKIDPEKEDVRSFIANIRENLEEPEDPEDEEYKISNPNIYPISARLSKLIRENMNGVELTRTEKRDMRDGIELFTEESDMNMTRHMPLSPTVYKRVQKRIDEAKKANDLNELAMLYSGVPVLEEVIQEYLEKYALPAKIHEAKGEFDRILEVHNHSVALDEELVKQKDNLEMVNKEVKEIRDRYAKGVEALKFKDKVQGYQWTTDSKSFLEKIGPIEVEFMAKLGEYQQNLGDRKISAGKAKKKLRKLKGQAEIDLNSIHNKLSEIIQSEVLTMINWFKDGYNKYAKALIGYGVRVDSPVMRELTKSVQLMFDPTELVDALKAAVEKRKLLWKVFPGLTKVDAGEAYATFANDLRNAFIELVKEAAQETQKQINTFKDKFIRKLDAINPKVDAIIREMEDKTSSLEKLEKSYKESQKKRVWLDNFQNELKDVLSI